MGMDIFGNKPSSEAGVYFRASVWSWRPIAEYVTTRHPALTKGCRHWHSNDGDGLSAAQARALGAALAADIAEGRLTDHIAERADRLARLPWEKCRFCGGTGIRTDAVGRSNGQELRLVESPPDNPRLGQVGWCNGCDGWGSTVQIEAWYPMELDHVREFADFLRDCGGFRIC